MPGPEHYEMAVFLVGTLKRLLYGFDCLDALAPQAESGSPMLAFYFDGIYNYTSLLFLLNKADRPMGGSAFIALERFGLESLLKPVQAVLDEPIGDTTFGEAIRLFRNGAIVHATHSDSDLDRVYSLLEMSIEENQGRWIDLLHELRSVVSEFMVAVAASTGRPLSDFGIS